ncbi:MAG: hypothetical protein Q8Q85_15655, partial [Gemmatimonadales bacterium]|nr:hypothetical protein [Gemmatimonadales bacterium]
AAERVWSGLEPEPAVQADALRVELALAGEGTGLDAASSVERLAAVRTGDSTTVAANACLVALWRAQHGDTSPVDAERFRQPARQCSWAIELLRAAAPGAADGDRRIAAADSAFRNTLILEFVPRYEALLLARVWESRGDLRRALAAIRLRMYGPGLSEGCCWREEGRLAALAGDTAGAIRAYRTYLVMRQDAEPLLIPQRDSVRAEVARLERRQ